MKIELLRDARVHHKAGEIVEVSPSEGAFLMSVGSARPVVDDVLTDPEQPTKKPSTKRTKK